MKILLKVLIFILCIVLIDGLHAQPGEGGDPIIPLQQNRSVLFGKDIIINDQPTETQQKVALCYAFNGWMYAAVTYKGGVWGNDPSVTVMKSIDNGLTWTVVLDGCYLQSTAEFTSVDILVTGNSTTNLKVFLALVAASSSTLIGYGFVCRYNEETGAQESLLFSNSFCYDIALASDFMYPASNSNPISIGVLYSQYAYSGGGDSIFFRYSTNGGVTMENRKGVAGSVNRCHKVALAYGRSPSWSTGRYFAAWEEQDDFGSMPGHIYTSHTDPYINSPFTAPVNLDGLDAADFNKCMNPAIACQYNNVDNDSSNLSEVVLFEKYNQSNQRYDIRGYYNLQAANHSKFKKLNISDSLHNNLQPDISFNPYDSTFMVTYYDSTLQKLPFLTNNFNLTNPDTWNIVSSGYNDNSNLSAPHPKVEITSNLQTGANVWIAGGNGSNGVAMFDAPSSTWTGVLETRSTDGTRLIGTYPNPCSNEINIAFELKKTEKVTIKIFSILGQPLETIVNQSYPEGKNIVRYDVSDFPIGSYLYSFRSGGFSSSGKFSVIR